MISLRPYQADTARRLVVAMQQGRRAPLTVIPTGGGKTVLFGHLAARWPGRVTIAAHRRELVRQASEKLAAAGVDHGIIAPGFPENPGARVQVGSVQTLAGRDIPPAGLLVADEAHHAVTPQWRALIGRNPGAVLAGFTATPERLDGTGLGDVFDSLIQGPAIPELQAGGFLSPVRVFAPEAIPDPRGIAEGGGESQMNRPAVIGDAAEHLQWHAPAEPAIAFCCSIAHAEAVAAAFRGRGWRAVAVSGKSPRAERDAAIAGLATGAVEVLCSCDLISEGLDVPAVGAVLLLRHTQSLGLFLQWVGRGMRPAPGKRFLSVLDHAGNTMRHGMPDSARDWTLDGAKRGKGAAAVPAIRQCSHCYAIHAPAPACPACGTASSPANASGPRRVRLRDGRLTELTAEDVRLLASPLRDLLREARNRAEVERIADVRGYHPAWVDRMMRYKRVRPVHTSAAEDFAA